MSYPFQGLHVEYHILQSFPVTCLNRDDVGAPKSAIVGGVPRARVSSQCWKRQVREELHGLGVRIGMRTVLDAYIKDGCLELGASEEQAMACGKAFVNELLKEKKEKNKDDGEGKAKEKKDEADKDSNILFFFTKQEGLAFAEHARSHGFDSSKIKQKDLIALVKKVKEENKNIDGLDIALFGRMVAKAATMNVEAAASFAHAISTHKSVSEVEFFTALDENPKKEGPGAAHMGSLEFNSATYYRYISLDLGQLYRNLYGDGACGDEYCQGMQDAVDAFTKALYLAVPAARQTTQSGAAFWDFGHILVRKGQRLQASFETPVPFKGGGYLAPSIDDLEKFLAKKEQEAGSLFQKRGEITIGQGSDETIDTVVARLKNMVAEARE